MESASSPFTEISQALAEQLPPLSANAAAIDDKLIMEIEQALMKLSDAISSSFLTSNERSEMMWEALA